MVDVTGRIFFVLGGAKSGKSRFALEKASLHPGRRAYIATAQAFDDEMAERIKKHRCERSSEWETFEEPVDVPALIGKIAGSYDTILIDCLTLWLSNLMLRNEETVEGYVDDLLSVLLEREKASFYLVSNEVGTGIVPTNALARRFRDCAGSLNQRAARAADEVYVVTAGIPLKIKP